MKLKIAVLAVMSAVLAASTFAVPLSAQVSYEEAELYLEAEDGSLTSAIEIGEDSSASAGEYISVTSGENADSPEQEAAYEFSVPESDTYHLWARLYGPDDESDAIYIGIDGSWDRVYPAEQGEYIWTRVGPERDSTGKYGVSLSSGGHEIHVGHAELHARLDALFVTDDWDARPDDTDDPGSEPPDAEQPQGRIAFSTDRDGNREIYVMDADGSNQVRLTHSPADDEWPTWSPDGSKIAFVSSRDGNREIYVMDADGSDQVRLTNSPGWDEGTTWSPDGGKIAFMSDRNGDWEIYVMDADGSNQVRLTSGGDNSGLVWSPDGGKIAFVTYENDNYKIYVMGADGSNQVRLTSNGSNAGPAWSPDGGKIAFNDHEDGSVFVMDADGSDQAMLTDDADYSPLWSPDGSKIAFYSLRDGYADSYMINADGSNQVRLTNNPTSDWVSSWSPDGSKIVFISERDGNGEIYVMNADGSNQVRLTNSPGWEQGPAWSPVGTTPDTPEARSNFELYLEAEDGNLTSDVEVDQDDDALGGAYISATSGTNTRSPKKEASYSFSVPEDGTYYLWARLFGPDEDSDAIYIGIDGSWNRLYPAETNEYLWERVETSRNSDEHEFSLDAGQHEVQAGHADLDTRLDALVVTDDPDFHPWLAELYSALTATGPGCVSLI